MHCSTLQLCSALKDAEQASGCYCRLHLRRLLRRVHGCRMGYGGLVSVSALAQTVMWPSHPCRIASQDPAHAASLPIAAAICHAPHALQNLPHALLPDAHLLR